MKSRSLAEAMEHVKMGEWLDPESPHRWDVLRCMLTLGTELSRNFPRPRGVFKFRSIEGKNAADEKWDRELTEYLLAMKDDSNEDSFNRAKK